MGDVSVRLRAGREFPRAWGQFVDWFGTDVGCRRYLEQLRWPQGFQCPACRSTEPPYRSGRGHLLSRTPLRTWFAAI